MIVTRGEEMSEASAAPGGKEQATVSVVLVLWNCAAFLRPCLESLRVQTLKGLEVVAVDNASDDGSASLFAAEMPGCSVVENSTNLGFAGAANQGVGMTGGTFVLLLNPDVVLEPDFLERMTTALRTADHRTGWAAAKLLRMEGGRPTTIIDSTGHFLTRARYPHNRGWGEEDRGAYDQETRVFGSCAAAALYRRTMLDQVALDGELFDADFSSYFEDADLDWRAALAGWRCQYVPEAVAWHERGGSGGEALVRVKKDMIRNQLLMMVKNDRLGMILADLPFLFLYWTRLLGRMLLDPRLFAGLFAALGLLPKMLGKRRLVQAGRTVSRQEIRSWFVDRSLRAKLAVILHRATGGRHEH
jgi:GT2 family glycosyltransferase